MTSVRDIEVHGDDLVIATHGRGFWVLDDVSPLRQAADVPADAAVLALSARRSRAACARTSGRARPFPKDEPTAANPPAGAYIDYVLRTPPRRAGRARDRRRLGRPGAPLQQRRRAAGLRPAADAGRARVVQDAVDARGDAPGMHRFVWPLHYPPPPALAGGDAFADGVWAPPGEYTVTLVVDGQPAEPAADGRSPTRASRSRPRPIARSSTSRARSRGCRPRPRPARKPTDALIAALAERRKTATGELAAAMERLEAKAWELAGTTPRATATAAGGGRPGARRRWRHLAETLESLAAAVDGADAEPTPDARAGVAQARTALERVRERRPGSTERVALDARLVAAGQPRLVP